jgi:hypothetical protein
MEEEMTLTENSFPTGAFVHEGNESWVLQFNDDGSYLSFVKGVVDATGTYSITGRP